MEREELIQIDLSVQELLFISNMININSSTLKDFMNTYCHTIKYKDELSDIHLAINIFWKIVDKIWHTEKFEYDSDKEVLMTLEEIEKALWKKIRIIESTKWLN